MVIYCDESGFSGPNLLVADQPFFVYAGVSLDDELVKEMLDYVKANYPVQKEIKGRNLVQNDKGQKVISEIFRRYNSRAKIVYHDKKYALAAKIFEYAIEPNMVSNQMAYETGFNRFIATGLYAYFVTATDDAEHIFRSFMDTVRGDSKTALFEINHHEKNYLLWWLFEIVKYDPKTLFNEIGTDGKIDPWILDLTTTSLMGILNEYGKHHDEFTVVCDDCNLLKESDVVQGLNQIGSHGYRAEFLGATMGYKLKQDIILKNSKKDPGLQVADLFATGVGFSLRNAETDFAKEILGIVNSNCLCDPSFCILPNLKAGWDQEKVAFYHKFMHLIWVMQREGKKRKRGAGKAPKNSPDSH
ncbi:MAG: DUF3800 domain-containing protein [Bacteroidetes bacterium]|nr:DUF3800 domain-containing protein [Bacteroidota bacterium]